MRPFTNPYTTTTTAQDHDNWLIHDDRNGQLIGWITASQDGYFNTARIRYSIDSCFVSKSFQTLEEAEQHIINSLDYGRAK